MTAESSLKTLRQLQTTRRPAVLMFAASFLWTRQNTASLTDLKATLGIDATLDTIDAELRVAAENRYDELLQWCIRTTARLDGTTVRNPAAWLPDTVRALEALRAAGDTAALLTQIAMTDDLLQAAAHGRHLGNTPLDTHRSDKTVDRAGPAPLAPAESDSEELWSSPIGLHWNAACRGRCPAERAEQVS